MKEDLINKPYLILFALLLPLAVWAETKNPNFVIILADEKLVNALLVPIG